MGGLRPVAGAASAAPVGEPGCTFGVEEEFLVADGSGRAAPDAEAVLCALAGDPSEVCYQPELISSQVEIATGVCTEAGELERQLLLGRGRLADIAAGGGLRVLAAGTPPLPGYAAVSAGDRYARVARTFGAVASDYQACGCHVHVGVADRELAVRVLNHLRPWLPVLLALGVNSPLHQGSDTGYGSWRIVQQSRFPVSGPPPWFADPADYEEQVGRLVECGALVDRAQTFWLARLSPHLPTVELRVADTALTAREAVAQAALARALVRAAAAEVEAGREAPPVREHSARAALWCAARRGLDGRGLGLPEDRPVPAAELVQRLFAFVRPQLAETGDLALVRASLTDLLRDGPGARRQRAAAAAGRRALLDLLSLRGDGTAAQEIPAARVEAPWE